MKKIAVLSVSGGMDSTSLLLHLLREGYEVKTLSFNYGQKHSIELERFKDNLQYLDRQGYIVEHNIIDLSILGKLYHSSLTSEYIDTPEGNYTDDSMKVTVVPNRNTIFASIIFGYALSLSEKNNCDIKICLGVHQGDHSIYPDCRPEFYEELDKVFKLGNWNADKVQNLLPYLYIDKGGILRDAILSCDVLKLDFQTIFKNTNTCYKPDKLGRACGRCGSCVERLEAFQKVNLIDPVSYCI